MTDTRMCSEPRAKTLRCYRPATLKGGYWECTAGHIVPDTGPEVAMPVTVPEPPTGPAAEPYAEPEGLPPAFVEFMDTNDGQLFFEKLAQKAMGKLLLGVPRFSVRGFVYEWREARGGRVNNTWTPWLADALLVRHPELEAIVERRARKKPGPDPTQEVL